MAKLTPERWSRLEDLFRQALELDAGQRDAFVDSQTVDDPEIARELRGMLAYAHPPRH